YLRYGGKRLRRRHAWPEYDEHVAIVGRRQCRRRAAYQGKDGKSRRTEAGVACARASAGPEKQARQNEHDAEKEEPEQVPKQRNGRIHSYTVDPEHPVRKNSIKNMPGAKSYQRVPKDQAVARRQRK